MLPPRHLVLIPSYNTGPILRQTVHGALAQNTPVWVVADGSSDGSPDLLDEFETSHPDRFRLLRLTRNSGKGAAILHGLKEAVAAGYSHILSFDADGQHPASSIPRFVAQSMEHPEAAVFGRPVFDASAPALRVNGRKVSNFFAHLETLGWGIDDSLFGMRLYPAAKLLEVFESTCYGRRFDFDPEVAVRLAWLGVPIINLPTPVRYLTREEGGVSQFRYLRDNTLLTWMHLRLGAGFAMRLPWLCFRGENPLLHLSPPPP